MSGYENGQEYGAQPAPIYGKRTLVMHYLSI